MGPLGWQETVFIFILALLLFGPKKLPELGRTLGKAMTEFRRASAELKSTFDREMQSLERENESIKEVTTDYSYDNSYNYDYSSYESGYGSESYDSTATENNSTLSASATEGAESTIAVTPEGHHATEGAEGAVAEQISPVPEQAGAAHPEPADHSASHTTEKNT